MKNTIQIEAYSLYEFCQKVQESILDGYRFNFESNDMFPTAFGSLLVAGLEKVQVEDTTQNTTEEVIEVVSKARKSKIQ